MSSLTENIFLKSLIPLKNSDNRFFLFSLLLLLFLFGSASCSLSDEKIAVEETASPASVIESPAPTEAPLTADVSFTPILNYGMDLVPRCFSDGYFYCTSDEKTGEAIPDKVVKEAARKKKPVVNDGRYDVFSTALYKVAPNGRVAKLSGYNPVGSEENKKGWSDFCSVSSFDALKRKENGSFIALEHTTSSGNSAPSERNHFDRTKNYLEYEEHYYLRNLDQTGRNLLTREISKKEAMRMLESGTFSSAPPDYPFAFLDVGVLPTSVVSDVAVLKNTHGYRFMTSSFDSDSREYSYELVTVRPRTVSPGEKYTVLHLAGKTDSERLDAEIAKFNRNHSGQINIRKISDSSEDYSKADILYLPVSESHALAEKNLLQDLYSLMALDTTLMKESFLPNILRAAEVNGKLYLTCSGFEISTYVGAASVVGNRCSWNYDEFTSAWWNLGQGADAFDVYATSEKIYALCEQMDRAFLTEEGWEQLKNFCTLFPNQYSYLDFYSSAAAADLRVRNKNQMLLRAELHCFDDVIKCGNEFGEEISYVGLPTLYGPGSTVRITTLDAGMNFSITSASCEKEAAWEFLRTFFTSAFQNEMSQTGRFFPSRITSFNLGLNEAMTGERAVDAEGNAVVNENGEPVYVSVATMYLSDFTPVFCFPLSEQRAQNFRELAESVWKLTNE